MRPEPPCCRRRAPRRRRYPFGLRRQSLEPIFADRRAKSIAIGPERTAEQDPAFAFRVIVDIAAKALSPAINDPTTAVLAIDQLHRLLRKVAHRRLDNGEVYGADGALRLVFRTPNWEDFVSLAMSEIRQYGGSSLQVSRRLHALLESLIAALPPARVPALRAELELLDRGIDRSFEDAVDRDRARVADSQGLGAASSHSEAR